MLLIKHFFLLITVIITINLGQCQDTSGHYHLAKYAIGISPSALINLYPGIQISQDIRLHKNINLSVETAYLYDAAFIRTSVKGFRLKMGLELVDKMQNDYALAIGLYALSRKTIRKRYASFYHEQRYIQKYPYDESRLLIGGEIAYRLIIKFSDRLFIEFGNGLGLGFLKNTKNGYYPPGSALEDHDFDLYVEDTDHINYVIISTNLNFSYRLVY